MKGLRLFGVLILLVLVFLLAYFIKCQLDIRLIKNFPLDKYPPLSLLQNRNPDHIVDGPPPGVDLLPNRLFFWSNAGVWSDLWMRDSGMVTLGHESGALVVTNRGARDWSLGHKKMFRVSLGEIYSFSGWVKVRGQNAIGELSVVLLDADKHVIQWHFAPESVRETHDWKRLERELTVPSGVKYIRFRLCGWGEGQVWFSGLKFMKKMALPLPGHPH